MHKGFNPCIRGLGQVFDEKAVGPLKEITVNANSHTVMAKK
jgi:hypothetical protein